MVVEQLVYRQGNVTNMFQSDASRVNTDKPTLVLNETVLLPMDKVAAVGHCQRN